MGDSHVGLQARLMSQALRKLTSIVSKTNCIVIFINQLREKIGVMFGNPETTTGGRALKFYASVRLDVRRTEALKQSGEVVGNHTRVKVVKIRLHRLSKRQSSILYLEREYPQTEIFWIWQRNVESLPRAVRGMHIMTRRSDREEKMQSSFFMTILRFAMK